MVPFTSSFTGRQQEIGDREWSSAVQKVFVLIASTILYYEYFETLPQEVARIWRAQKRLSWLNVLFYLNRYFILLGQCGVLLRAFWPGSVGDPNRLEICKALTFYHQFFGASVHLIVEAFMIIRVSALYDWSRRVMAFLLFVGIAAVTNAAISISTSKKVDWNKDNIPLNTCMLPNDEHNAHRLALAWAGLLILNIVIIMFTAKKALGDPSLQKSVILQLLLRDGTFYFGIMALLIVASVASWLTSDPYLRGSATTISNVIASCLATRLILNMRDPALYSHLKPAAVPTDPTEVPTVQWAQKKVDNETEFDSEDSKTTFDLVTGGNITTQFATVHDYRDRCHERQRKRDESPV